MDVLSVPDSDDEDEECCDHLGDEQVPPTSLDDDGAAGPARSHKKSKEPRGEATGATDGRSVALAAVVALAPVAHAVEYGSLGEQLYYANLAVARSTRTAARASPRSASSAPAISPTV